MALSVEAIELTDDGFVPNHPTYPLLLYPGAFLDNGAVSRSEEAINTFSANGWQGAWVNGIFRYHHYHARSHEVLANLGDAVTVQFGGASGPILTFEQGMAVAIPAGCGHCRLSQPDDLRIVGAYPGGQENWDLKRADTPADYAQAKAEVERVARPTNDPVFGAGGPLLEHWI